MYQIRRQQRANAIIGALVTLLILGIALVVGATSSLGNPLFLLPFLLLGGAIAIIAAPTAWVVWFLFAAAFVLTGPLIYFRVADTPARWLTVLMGTALLIPLLGRLALGTLGQSVRYQPMFVLWLWLFLFSALFSSVIDEPTVGETFNAFRSYLAYLPLMFLLMMGVWQAGAFANAWKAMLAVGLLQLPVAAYQHFVVAPKSSHSAQLDAVVGTFPGNAEGGGANAAMGVFVVICMIFALALWRRGMFKTWQAIGIVLAGIGTIGLAEVKAVVLLIPLAIGMLFYRELARRPLTVALAFVVGVLLSAGLLYTYNQLHYEERRAELSTTDKPESPIEAIQNQLNPDRETKYTNTPSRAAALKDWWERNVGREDVQHSLFGHGVGSTQATRFGTGELTKTIFYTLDQTSTAMLLWEVGIVGHLLLVVTLLSAARTASTVSRAAVVPVMHQAFLHATSVTLVLFTITLPYKSFALKTSPSQILLMLLLGYTGFWAREVYRARQAELHEAHRAMGLSGRARLRQAPSGLPTATTANASHT